METPDVRRALDALEPTKTEGSIGIDDASYFLSKIELTQCKEPTMPTWRKNLFIATSRLSTDSAEYFNLSLKTGPDRRVADRGLTTSVSRHLPNDSLLKQAGGCNGRHHCVIAVRLGRRRLHRGVNAGMCECDWRRPHYRYWSTPRGYRLCPS
jgi:hypothetical protein